MYAVRQTLGQTLAEVSEEQLLARIFPLLPSSNRVVVAPGDDTALLQTSSQTLATTDTMVRGRDWLDEWSNATDVGAKAVAQNVADIAAMGGRATGLLVTLVADPDTQVEWAIEMARGLGEAARELGVAVLGGDLSSAPPGTLMVSVTALGEADGAPVLRSGAQPGDVVAVAGSLGRSAAGLALLEAGRADESADLVSYHCRPRPPYEQGPIALTHGASAMLDLSDGLVRDAARIAKASRVRLDLNTSGMRDDLALLRPLLGEEGARECVLTGGEEHSLLACFGAAEVPTVGWRVVGEVSAGEGLFVDGEAQSGGGWDHFNG